MALLPERGSPHSLLMSRQVARRAGEAGAPRAIALLAFEHAQMLDVVGPLEVFASADRCLRQLGIVRRRAYVLDIVAERAGPLLTTSGLRVLATRAIGERRHAIGSLVVAGGDGVWTARQDRRLLRWIERTAASARRTASVCSGAFLLAEAGLLDGRRATTHWEDCARLAREFPTTTVEPDRIYVRDGDLYTSGGVTAGMDLALALVEQDWGREIALRVARTLVLFLRRPGGQSQFSQHLLAEQGRDPIRRAQRYAVEHPAADLSVAALAEVAAMSPRSFARAFLADTVPPPPSSSNAPASRRRASASSESTAAIKSSRATAA